ncbi:outer membrane beta-barrel protein [Breoghania sp. L-A4]|uniref:outer membrane beta-barrel protein n=1 Tax=Breoghania sp. L-A4 TaxID=2304600 RepID=UPI0013C2EABF|nr:outer membrane beta-barrel protein [Breoghania sp. L-A4]
MPYRLRLGLCLFALAGPAAAQQMDDPMALRGVMARDDERDAATDMGADAETPADAVDTVEAASEQPLLIDAVEANAPQGRVRSVQPLTTGSIRPGSQPIEDEGVFGGDTQRDAARGIRAGSFLVFPELTLRGGVTDNASGAPGGASGSLYRVEPGLRLRSDWERHAYELSLRGSYKGYIDDPDDNAPSLDYSSSLRIDATDETTLEGTLTYALATEGRSTAESAGNTGKRVLSHDLEGTLSATREVGLIAATLRGSVGGSAYTGGTGTSRNNAVASAGLRLGYDFRAAISPFAEAAVLGRMYENAPGRDALGYELRGGLAIDRGDKLSGEVAVGYHLEDLEGTGFKTLEGVLVEAALVWSPSRLTTVTLNASTAFEATSLAGSSGSIVYGGDATVAHSLTSDLAVDAGGTAAYRRYQGLDLEELTLSGSVGATYAITSYAAVQARYTYEWFDSTQAGSNYTSNTIEAGLRLRR